MKCMIVVSCLVALAAANPGYLGGAGIAGYAAPAIAAYGAHGIAAYGAPAIAAAPAVSYSAIVAPGAVTSQYHTQDTLGQYAYGYQGDTSAKQEVRTADGITQGGYSYLDAHGLVQSASYVSDPLNGFRVAATNDPSITASAAAPAVLAASPAVVAADAVQITAARAAGVDAHLAAKAALLGRRKRSPGYLGAAVGPVAVAHAAPAVVAAAPAVVAAAPVSTFSYSSVSAHPATVVGYAAHVAPVAVAHAAPVAVAHAAPYAVADAAHIAAKAALLGRKKRSPGFLHGAAVAAPLAYAAPLAVHGSVAVHHPIAATYAHAPILAL